MSKIGGKCLDWLCTIVIVVVCAVPLLMCYIIPWYNKRRQNEDGQKPNTALQQTIAIVLFSIIVAVILTFVIHKVYLAMWKHIALVKSVFSEIDIVSLCLGIITAVTAIMIYYQQTVEATREQQAEQQRNDMYKAALHRFYAVCLYAELQAKHNEVLPKVSAVWDANSITRIQLLLDDKQYWLIIGLTTNVRTQNNFAVNFECTVVNSPEENELVFNIQEHTHTDMPIPEHAPDELVIPIMNADANDTLNALLTKVHTSMYKCALIGTPQEVRLCFKELQHTQLKIPCNVKEVVNELFTNLQHDEETHIDDDSIANLLKYKKENYSVDLHITLDDGVLGINRVMFTQCNTWRVDINEITDTQATS